MEPALAPSTGEVSPQLPGSPSRKSGASRRGNEHPPAPPVSTIPDGVSDAPASGQDGSKKPAKRRKHRNRKRRNRRPSFLVTPPAPAESQDPEAGANGQQTSSEHPVSKPSLTPYKLGGNLSTTSLESDTLLDHRNHTTMPRRESRLAQSFRPSSLTAALRSADRNRQSTPRNRKEEEDEEAVDEVDDRTPLIRPSTGHSGSFTRYGSENRMNPFTFRSRKSSMSTASSRFSPRDGTKSPTLTGQDRDYDVNNPPSIPGSPHLGPSKNYDDAVVTGAEFDFSTAKSLDRKSSINRLHDAVIDMDGNRPKPSPPSTGSSPELQPQDSLRRRKTVSLPVEEDVCFPTEVMSELAEEDTARTSREQSTADRRRRRQREWPDLSVLEEWSREEKEERSGDLRVKKISEPMLIDGRLRPQFRTWRREEDEVPYRFTYFNEEFPSTIHAQTISELVQPGTSFRELFIPDPPEVEDSSDEDEPYPSNGNMDGANASDNNNSNNHNANGFNAAAPLSRIDSAKGQQRTLSVIGEALPGQRRTPSNSPAPTQQPAKPKRYGPRPTFWLDVLCPTDAEMRVIAKAFGIHALTAEDIMMQEAREKVELFRKYYFVNYRTFEQDPNKENYLEPVNMYVVVFREGVLSFHFSPTPHPANVRRRIRQLMDYLILSSDWISYALIDDITDVFGPLIQSIEQEVDEIDEFIMQMHSPDKEDNQSRSGVPDSFSPGEMLRRVGECRKKVMGMYRLLSNKADVVKGFAKRCNEQWEVAPKSEIGLYLGDIQDHILTMTSNLTHYETILSRAHSNYLAQINILMNERQEQTADVLGKLTVLGTIVLPMNIICGMWGMNVKVPGQDVDNLWWFWSITAGLFVFAFASFVIAKRVYNIV